MFKVIVSSKAHVNQLVGTNNGWLIYLHITFLLSFTLFDHFIRKMTFGGKGVQKVHIATIGTVNIRRPLANMSYFDYESKLIGNDIPMLHGLRTQINLKAVTHKDSQNLRTTFNAL